MTEKQVKLSKKERDAFNKGLKLGLTVAVKTNLDMLYRLFPETAQKPEVKSNE